MSVPIFTLNLYATTVKITKIYEVIHLMYIVSFNLIKVLRLLMSLLHFKTKKIKNWLLIQLVYSNTFNLHPYLVCGGVCTRMYICIYV